MPVKGHRRTTKKMTPTHRPAATAPAETLPPPSDFLGRLRQVGPSLILTAGIVGSGELIVTTTLGARLGFAALWLILLSCASKVVLQVEIGRYAISSGDSSLRSADRIPGPRWRASWVVWGWLLSTLISACLVGGIVGGVAQCLTLVLPQLSVTAWGVIACLVTLGILLSGGYSVVERGAMLMVVAFSLTTVVAAGALQWSGHALSPENVWEGLTFQLPAQGGLALAFALFGLTGVGTSDLFAYPNWCLEKGYARHIGPRSGRPDWNQRARGWIRVMQLDALLAMGIYTTITVAFYLLGAAVLHGQGLVPEGGQMIATLSRTFTGIFGPWGYFVFLTGALVTLYSTLFASVAANAIMGLDCLTVFGFLARNRPLQRVRWRRGLQVFWAAVYATIFLAFPEQPVQLIVVGGVVQTGMLPVIACSILYLRYRRLDRGIGPSPWVDWLLWLSAGLTLCVAAYTLLGHLDG